MPPATAGNGANPNIPYEIAIRGAWTRVDQELKRFLESRRFRGCRRPSRRRLAASGSAGNLCLLGSCELSPLRRSPPTWPARASNGSESHDFIDAGLHRWPAPGGRAVARSGAVFLRDAGHGLLEVGHNSLALFGLLLVGVALFASSRPDVRHAIEAHTLSWLQARHEARLQATADPDAEPDLGEPDAILRATASDPKDLNRAQASVALWLSRRYRVAPEPVSRLVQEAWTVGALVDLDPTLILAVMAVESSFNPFAQSPVGAQGLMQVMTKVHDDKYEAFGGSHAAFDPVTNLRVGVQVLKECIAAPAAWRRGCAPTSAPPTPARTAATPPRCWPSRASFAWSPAAARCRRRPRRRRRHAKPRPRRRDAATPAPTAGSRQRPRRPSPRRRRDKIALRH